MARPRAGGEKSVVALFIERCRAYGATVHEVDADGVAGTVASAMNARGSSSLVVPPGLPGSWIEPAARTSRVEVDTGLSAEALDAIDTALTGSILAIAETGTIVLRADDHCGRRVISLIPDHHICVVHRRAILPGVADAFAALDASVAKQTALTFVSGPSATADIELKRVQGVHGPRKLDVIIYGDDQETE